MSAWDRIEKWLGTYAPKIRADLQGPATDEDIQALQAQTSVTLPAEMVEVYRHHNGQVGMKPGVAGDWQLLSLEDAAGQWKMQKSLLDDGSFDGSQAKAVGPVRADWWNAHWIPFAFNGSGDLQCVDLAPAPGGQKGQVVIYHHDRPERECAATSLEDWLEKLASDFEAGKYDVKGERIHRK